jgi:hypothetical protein
MIPQSREASGRSDDGSVSVTVASLAADVPRLLEPAAGVSRWVRARHPMLVAALAITEDVEAAVTVLVDLIR